MFAIHIKCCPRVCPGGSTRIRHCVQRFFGSVRGYSSTKRLSARARLRFAPDFRRSSRAVAATPAKQLQKKVSNRRDKAKYACQRGDRCGCSNNDLVYLCNIHLDLLECRHPYGDRLVKGAHLHSALVRPDLNVCSYFDCQGLVASRLRRKLPFPFNRLCGRSGPFLRSRRFNLHVIAVERGFYRLSKFSLSFVNCTRAVGHVPKVGEEDCDSVMFGVNFLRREIAQYSKGTGSRHSCGKD